MDSPDDNERYPTLSAHGAEMLRFLREHPSAPIFRNQSGNRLTQDDVARVREFEREVERAVVEYSATEPAWIPALLGRCYTEVPHYRRLGAAPRKLVDVPTVQRADLARNIADFVPDDVSVDRLINFRTTGTTGTPLLVASHPRVAASYLAFHKRAFRRFGVELTSRRGQVGVVLLGFQKQCFTYVSVTPTMDDSGLAKLNLHPDDWRRPEDRASYLEALNAEVVAGDPLSFAELLKLPVELHPKVLLSTSMSLSRGLRDALAQRFRCPVLDVYSMNEAGPIAVYDADAGGHVLLQHEMHVEILDEHDQPVPMGRTGEVTLSGGFNFCLPLLRYRTGDFARLERFGNEPVLREFEGRRPVTFETTRGERINNIDVTHALLDLPIAQYSLHQHSDGRLTLSLSGYFGPTALVRARFERLFGSDQELEIHADAIFDGKVRQYSSDRHPGALS
jgi:phenylacetate-CoA ligase